LRALWLATATCWLRGSAWPRRRPCWSNPDCGPNPSLDLSLTSGAILNSPGEREIGLGYAHTFELGGKRERRIEAGKAGVDLVRAGIADRERLLRADVRSRFAEALAAARNLESAGRLLELNQQSYEIAQARTRQGEGSPLEEGLLRVEVNRIRSDRLLFANQVERAVAQLKTLCGRAPDEPLRISGVLAAPALTVSLESALERAIGARPDLLAARIEEALDDAALRMARSDAVPNLVASARYSRVTARFDQFGLAGPGGPVVPLRDTDNLLSGGISINLPLRNRNQGNIQAAVARRQSAALRRRFVEQVVREEVSTAFRRYQTARQALAIFDEGVIRQSQENVRILRAAYQLGEIRLMDVINEQRRLVDTQRAYTELLKEARLAEVELERAVGAPIF
jgi:cobalt-zinc-cadmium efflux system outer membrane protein